MAAKTYAFMQGGVVHELIEVPDGADIADRYTQQFLAECIECTAVSGIAQGWAWNGSVFLAPPEPAPPTPGELAEAAVMAGYEISSNSWPVIDGIYAIDPIAQGRIAAVSNYILVNGKFPGGTATYPWLDISKTAHTFPSTAAFQAWATAIADYVAVLDMIVATGEGELPAASITIT